MPWRTLMTVLSQPLPASPQTPALDLAIELARTKDAHLETLALGYDITEQGYYFATASFAVLQEALLGAQAKTDEIEAQLRERLSAEDIRWSVDPIVAANGMIGALVANRARFADLVVLPRPYGPGRTKVDETVLEAALFDAGVPVLVLPDGVTALPARPKRICVAWNQSPEALAAIRKALPLLQEAEEVDITIIDPPVQGPERSDPGGMLSQWLARHGVRAEISVLARTLPKVSDVLLRHAREKDCELLVMGAYGHSRFREAILGGATRELLEHATLPVLMAR